MQLDDFWKSDVCEISEFSNLPLEPLGDAAGEVLLAGSRSRAVANGFSDGFDQPERLSPWIVDRGAARRRISDATGRPWRQTVQAARPRMALDRTRRLRSLPRKPLSVAGEPIEEDVP